MHSFDYIKSKFVNTRARIRAVLSHIQGSSYQYAEVLDMLETELIRADVSLATTNYLMDGVKNCSSHTVEDVKNALKIGMLGLLNATQGKKLSFHQKPTVIVLIGVNGSGKTTTLGKLAHHFKQEKKSILIAAGDTFRAAATHQLMMWAEKNHVEMITQKTASPATVIFDTISSARSRQIDIVLADTAGRLPTQAHLMQEMTKLDRVIQKALEGNLYETWLVLDGTTGQNAIHQVKAFQNAMKVTGLIVTKLDGTAKGGILLTLAHTFNIPIQYIGLGEAIDDIHPFDASLFVEGLLEI